MSIKRKLIAAMSEKLFGQAEILADMAASFKYREE
jgi:hypothetical protein